MRTTAYIVCARGINASLAGELELRRSEEVIDTGHIAAACGSCAQDQGSLEVHPSKHSGSMGGQ